MNTALGNFVEVETDLPFGGLLAGLTFRAHLQLPVGPGGGVRAGLVVVGVDPPGGGHLDRGVRGSGRAAGRVPAHRDGLRAGRRDRRPGRAGGVGAGAGVVRRAALGVRRRGPAGAHLGGPGHRGPVRARRRRPAGRAGPRARASAGPRVGRRPHRRGVRLATGGASPTATTADCWPTADGPAGRAPLRVGRRGPGGVGDRRGRRRGAGQHLRRPGPGADPALAVRAAGHLLLRVGRVDGGRRRLRRPDQRLPARPRRAPGRGHRRARAHAAQALRRLGEPGRDRRAGRWGDPSGVRRPWAPGAPHDAGRGGVHGLVGRRGPGGDGLGCRRADPLHLLRRRADPVRDRRPGGRGDPAAGARRAGGGGDRPGRGEGPAASRR